MGRVLVCLLWSLAGLGNAAAWTSPAPDVVLYCDPALEGALGEVAARYTASSHVPVHIFTAPPDGLIGLLKHRARDDVVVAAATAIQAMAAGRLVRAETVVALGRNPYVLIGKSDAAFPEGADAARLLAAHSAVLTDPTTAATFDGAAVLHAALPEAALRTEGVADTGTVIARVREDGTLVGVVQQTQAGGADIRTLVRLAVPPSEVSGALVTQGQSGNASAFLAFVAGSQGQTILRNTGLETGS